MTLYYDYAEQGDKLLDLRALTRIDAYNTLIFGTVAAIYFSSVYNIYIYVVLPTGRNEIVYRKEVSWMRIQ